MLCIIPVVAQPSPPVSKRLPEPKPVASKPLAARGLQIAVAVDAPPEVRAAAEKILAAVPTQPLLQFMAGTNAPKGLSDSVQLASGPPAARAFDHLVVVGLPTDPLMTAAWAREALFAGNDAYIFGYGHLRGDIGYVESDRNPFLHSRYVEKALYETEITLVTGTTPRGVTLAADAFLKRLVNGVVAAPGWTRPQPNLLQLDPLPADWAPSAFPEKLGEWTLAGYTQASEDEYRGVETDVKVRPKVIWRAKYVRPGVWDGVGAAKSFENYEAGLHRRASVNCLWAAQFDSEKQARLLAGGIAANAQLRAVTKNAAYFKGTQPLYSYRTDSMGDMAAWAKGDTVWMSTLPEAATNLLNPAGS
jgi:hypothetical protein